MQTSKRLLWLVISGILIICVASYLFDERNPLRQAEMVHTTLAWGRLAPFPKHARGFTIASTGLMFTHGFQASFSAPSQEITAWMQQSPGFRKAVKQQITDGITKYIIQPGDGAQYAEVMIDAKRNTVSVYVYWH